MRGRGTRRGNVVLLVAIFGAVIFTAIWSLGYLSKTDASATSNLLREIHATYLAESIAAQVEVQVNSRPWNRRFWLAPGVTQAQLDRNCPYVNLSGETLPAAEWDYVGVVKDLPDQLRQYRLYLEVTVRGETYAFTWDKRHQQTLLTGLSQDTTAVDKTMDLQGPVTATDTLLEGIKGKEDDAPPTDQSGPVQQQKLKDLKKDRPSHRARTLLPAPTASPADPQKVVADLNEQAQKIPVKEDKGNKGGGR